MKTTIDLADPLLAEAKAVAARERTTLRSLVEEGLRAVLAGRKRAGAFRLRKATFKGKGMQAGVDPEHWERIRDLAYRGRGA